MLKVPSFIAVEWIMHPSLSIVALIWNVLLDVLSSLFDGKLSWACMCAAHMWDYDWFVYGDANIEAQQRNQGDKNVCIPFEVHWVLVRQRANHRYIKQMRWKLKGKHQTFNLIYSASKYWMFKRHTYHTHANTCQKGCCRFDLTLLSSLSLRSIFSLFIIYSMQVANIDVMWLDA